MKTIKTAPSQNASLLSSQRRLAALQEKEAASAYLLNEDDSAIESIYVRAAGVHAADSRIRRHW